MYEFEEKMQEALKELAEEELMFFYRKHGALDNFFKIQYMGHSNWFVIPQNVEGNYLTNEKGEYLFIDREEKNEYPVSALETSEIKNVLKKRVEKLKKARKIKQLFEEPSSFGFECFFKQIILSDLSSISEKTKEEIMQEVYEYLKKCYSPLQIEEESARYLKKKKEQKGALKTIAHKRKLYLFPCLDHYFYVNIQNDEIIEELKYFDTSKESAIQCFKKKSHEYYEQNIQKQIESWG